MVEGGDDSDNESIKSQKSGNKCDLCGANYKSSVKCTNCQITVHKKCFEAFSKYVKLNKNDWLCKSCESKSVKAGMGSVESSKLEYLNRELDLMKKLHNEMETSNLLLKLRLKDCDEQYRNICQVENNSNNLSNNQILTTKQQMSRKATFADIAKKDSAVLVIESRNTNTGIETVRQLIQFNLVQK
ncbi:unnamed protein product [Brassicogethes aeneus]|uniref:Phorbol-ester/DAG-type domain-containing protein n=1 Tax=Brassicogethes aeneus TaxID=1431903 RepID=A0A9P0AXS1_BRAAE|nr:unnamed protein product [Brassicogethes aeneus]